MRCMVHVISQQGIVGHPSMHQLSTERRAQTTSIVSVVQSLFGSVSRPEAAELQVGAPA